MDFGALDPANMALGAFGLALGGILKGATGAGAPIIAVPLLAMLYDVPLAVALFTLPNLFSNAWQGWHYRAHQVSRRFVVLFAGGGALGAAIGTVMLARLPSQTLMLMVAVAVFAYVAFRLLRPDWALGRGMALRLAGPMGALGGMLQGAAGISAPVSVTFLNAMKLERVEFIATISVFFALMSVPQIILLSSFGIMTPERAVLSLAAVVPLFGAMPLGSWLAKRLSRETFDRIILGLLVVVAARLVINALG